MASIKSRGYGQINAAVGDTRPYFGSYFGSLLQTTSIQVMGQGDWMRACKQRIVLQADALNGFHIEWSTPEEISSLKGGTWYYQGQPIELETLALLENNGVLQTGYQNPKLTALEAAAVREHTVSVERSYSSFQLNEPTLWAALPADSNLDVWGSKLMLVMVSGIGPTGTPAFRKFRELVLAATGMQVLKSYRHLGCNEQAMYELVYNLSPNKFRALQQDIVRDPMKMLGIRQQELNAGSSTKGKLLMPWWAISADHLEEVLQVPSSELFVSARAVDSYYSDSAAWCAITGLAVYGVKVPDTTPEHKPKVMVELKSSDWDLRDARDIHPSLRHKLKGGL